MSFRLNPNGLKIQEGMILSNEPGYYEDGKFGIRIESIMVAQKVSCSSCASLSLVMDALLTACLYLYL